ncbi:MAG: hypothetical protein JWO28_590 [Hyphomicrobiales bacterium]|nr:hypothetical protein [Hyphomicrobiales bacterium]
MVAKKILFLCIPLALAGCNAIDPSADGDFGDYNFHDVLRPHGHSRNVSALHADSRTCERRTGHADTLAELPRIQSDPRYRGCMAARGWRFASYSPTPAAPQDDEDSSSDTPSDSATRDGAADIAEMQRGIDATNASSAAVAQATSAAAAAAAAAN